MTLAAASDMRRSASLKGRIESAASAHGKSIQWVDQNIAALCATDGWSSKWRDARMAAFEDGDEKRDVGVNINVITDEMIDAAVSDLIAADETAAQGAAQVADGNTFALLQYQVQQQATEIAALRARVEAASAADGATA